jgi:hypothetical protein
MVSDTESGTHIIGVPEQDVEGDIWTGEICNKRRLEKTA